MIPANIMSNILSNVKSLAIENTVAPAEAEIAAVVRVKAISEFIDLIARNEYGQEEFFAGFTNYDFNEAEIVRVCKALETNTKITCFTFGASAETHKKHLVTICELLKTNKTISSINLSKVNLGADGLKEIVRLLKTNQNITSLILKKCNIHEDQSVALLAHLMISNKTLLHLDLSGNHFSEENLNRIIAALSKNTSLQTLNLINVKAMNSAWAKRLAEVNSKIKLNQARDKQTKPDAAKDKNALLLELRKPEVHKPKVLTRPKAELERLFGSENKEELERKQQLEHGSNSGSEFDSSESEMVVTKKTSQHPKDYLYYSDLLDKQKLITAIRNKQCNQNTFDVVFGELEFQGDDLKFLLEALNTNPEIHTLKLDSWNKNSSQFSTICKLLSANTTIKCLNFSMFKIGEEGLEKLLELFKTNTTIVFLDIYWSGFYTKKAADLVRDLILTNTSLRTLKMGHMTFDKPVEFMMVFQALARNNTLQEISFESTSMLRMMSSNRKSLMMELLSVLKKHPSITAIDLNHNQFSVEEITELTTVLKGNPKIISLNLSQIGDDHTFCIKALPPQGYKILFEILANSKTLEHLAINMMSFDEQTMEQVLAALMLNTNILKLEFNNFVENESLTNFINYLKLQNCIVSIRLPRVFSLFNFFNDLEKAFMFNNRIKEVIFDSPSYESAWYDRLLKFLKDHPQITSATVHFYSNGQEQELRNQYQKRIEIQLYENGKPGRNAMRESFLEGFYRSKAYVRSLEATSSSSPLAPASTKDVNLLPRFRSFDKNILNNIFSFLDLDQAIRNAP